MIDEGMRHRRRVLGWTLVGVALVLLVGAVLFGRVLLDQMMLGAVDNSYALVTAVVVIFLAILGSGAYLLHTVRRR